MTPVDQTVFGVPSGNCFSACVASILEIPLADVPHFMTPVEGWWDRFCSWCDERGWRAAYTPDATAAPAGPAIAGVPSPRHAGWLHAVVAMDGRIVHDPHPDRDSLGADVLDRIWFERTERAA